MADEEDEDILDSWEEAADSGDLERRMEERDKQLKKEEKEEKKVNKNLNNGQHVTILKGESVGRTEYTPQIKILKRNQAVEKKDTVKQTSEAELKNVLKLREAEYQAARNRILGEDYDETKPKLPECSSDDDEGDTAKISIIKAGSSSRGSGTLVPALTSQSSSGGGIIKADTNSVRQPKGPDRQSSGFSIER